ncbi:MAG: hypothetical protein HY854_18435 [Burkholderiales bacterium]|nr:hypothetical protein [Burkholderiales bacterium]
MKHRIRGGIRRILTIGLRGMHLVGQGMRMVVLGMCVVDAPELLADRRGSAAERHRNACNPLERDRNHHEPGDEQSKERHHRGILSTRA